MKLFSSLKAKAQDFLEPYKQKEPATYAAAQQAIGGLLIADGFLGIDNPFGGKRRSGIFGTLIGVAVGIVFMFVPTIFNSLTGINKMTATTTATVVSVGAQTQNQTNSSNTSGSGSCSLTASYTVDGKQYTQQSAISSSDNCSKTPGETLTINYNPQEPGAWSSDAKSTGLFLMIFFWAGLLAVVTSIITFFIRLFSIIFGWKLLKSGRALAATLPAGTNLDTMINEIKHNFTGTVFNMGGVAIPTMPTMVPPAAPAPTPTFTASPPPPAPANPPTVPPESPTTPPEPPVV